ERGCDRPEVGRRALARLRLARLLAEVRREPAPEVGGTADQEGAAVRAEALGDPGARRDRSPHRLGAGLARGLGETRQARNGAPASAGRSCTWSCIVTSLTISYSFVPDGTFTSTVAPSSWPRSDLPIGDDGEIRPMVGSASSGVTIS